MAGEVRKGRKSAKYFPFTLILIKDKKGG